MRAPTLPSDACGYEGLHGGRTILSGRASEGDQSMLQIAPQPLAAFGSVITASPGATLDALPDDDIRALFRTRGVILFRGFCADDDAFVRLSQRFSSRFLGLVHPADLRETVESDGATSTVNLGNLLIAHHQEMGYSPIRPDILCFLCVVPARAKGETFLCDGVALWNKMDADQRNLFRSKKLRYTFPHAAPDMWPLFIGESRSRDETLAALAQMPGIRSHPSDDGTLHIEYEVEAVRRTRFGDQEAFVNSVIVQADGMSFADGSEIPKALRLRLLALATSLNASIAWQHGDIAMIDNSRFLHGRAAFDDEKREIHVRMSYANF